MKHNKKNIQTNPKITNLNILNNKQAYYQWCNAQNREGWLWKDNHHWDSPHYKKQEEAHEIESLCPKCKHTRAIPFSVQERSLDEGMTNYLRCSLCSHTIRI